MKTLRPTLTRKILALCNGQCWPWSRATKRRMRAAAGVLLAFLFLFFFIIQSEVPCRSESCQSSSELASLGPQRRSLFVSTHPTREWRNATVRRILRWTGFFEDQSWEETDDRYFASCAESRCTMTNDRSLLLQSDAVLFHVGAMVKSIRNSLPDQRTPEQVWILHNVEPPTRTPLNMKRYDGLFNWTAFYRRDSDVPVPYGGYTRYPLGDRYGHNHTVSFARRNVRFAAWMSSNCYDYNRRQLLIRQLKELLGDDLDLYGSCGGKRCPETICFDTISNYKFFFAFENANCRDYITEKFWSALIRGQVPVVLGGVSSKDYRKVAPPNSFLHVNDFASVEELVKHLRKVAADEDAYNSHLAWTRQYDIYNELPARRRWWCDVCQALHDRSRPAQTYTDLHGWYNDDICPQWTLMNQIRRIFDGLKIKMGLL